MDTTIKKLTENFKYRVAVTYIRLTRLTGVIQALVLYFFDYNWSFFRARRPIKRPWLAELSCSAIVGWERFTFRSIKVDLSSYWFCVQWDGRR